MRLTPPPPPPKLTRAVFVFSEHAIIVKSYSNKTIGHIPDGLAQFLSTLVKDGKIKQIYGVITGHARAAPEGTWTQGGIELQV